jgi:SPX domain protein involved in polyphosphate accumulation
VNEGDIITPPVLERYELKFTIPEYLIEPISDFVSIYCSLDKYSALTEDSYYCVNSLYFDTPYFLFLRNRLLGCKSRFNMRIRSYGHTPQLPYFFEVKQKDGNVIRKYRGKVYEAAWDTPFCLVDYKPQRIDNEKELRNIRLFQRLLHVYNAEPKVLTQYRRKAYVSDCENYARVTFDLELKYMAEDTCNLMPDRKRMVSYDMSTNFDSGCNVILELKCYTTQVPLWMIDCIRTFKLHRRSFSKYATGVREVFNLYKYDAGNRTSTVSL